jgi:hypothetical protein
MCSVVSRGLPFRTSEMMLACRRCCQVFLLQAVCFHQFFSGFNASGRLRGIVLLLKSSISRVSNSAKRCSAGVNLSCLWSSSSSRAVWCSFSFSLWMTAGKVFESRVFWSTGCRTHLLSFPRRIQRA